MFKGEWHMGIKIDMSNMTIDGNARILNDASFSSGDVDIKMSGTHIDGDAILMQGFVVNDFYNQLNENLHNMDTNSSEYQSIKRILQIPQNDKKLLAKEVTKHIYTFSKGVLENVLANYLSRGF